MPLGSRRLRALEAWLIGVGAICLAWYAGANVWAEHFQAEQNRVFECRGTCGSPSERPPKPGLRAPEVDPNLVGRLEIPRLETSVVVMNGDDDATLAHAAGHLPDSSMPWEQGNAAIAGHRDTFFRPLKDIQTGDEIRLVTMRGTFVYAVRNTRVVRPEDITVLTSEAAPTLTLVTCYPFYFVGNAPKRFVVRADLIASTPPSDDVR